MHALRRRMPVLVALLATLVVMSACMPLPRVIAPGAAPGYAPGIAPGIAPKSTRVLDRRAIGVSLYGSVLAWSRADLERDLDRVRAMGATWVRIPFNWVTLEMHGRGQYEWASADRIVAAANARHLHIDAVVSYTPGWARPAGRPGTDAPTNLDDYARFMHAIVARYAPRGVHTWEVWNEPNLVSMWTPKPNVARYTALLKKAYTAIKHADHSSVVLTGGLSPGYDAPDRT
ncbi:MAG: hypothetical protein JWL83_3859, partial [Actinomycetia bacterium]|nr:hypothetical protein [Actinomycetes bacterium]